jgi:hypothetical protein
MRIVLPLLLILLSTFAQAQQRSEQFPLIGLWHSVSAVTRDGRDITPKEGGMELQFLPDKTVIETVSASTKSDDQPVRTQYTYTFEAPDILSYTFHRGGRINSQHQRFRVTDDTVTFENLDSGIVTTMHRIQKSEFKAPKDIPELPK